MHRDTLVATHLCLRGPRTVKPTLPPGYTLVDVVGGATSSIEHSDKTEKETPLTFL